MEVSKNGDVDMHTFPAHAFEMEISVTQDKNNSRSLDSSSGSINLGFQHEVQEKDRSAQDEGKTSKETATVTDDEEDTEHSAPCCVLFLWLRLLRTTLSQYSQVIGRCVGVVLLLAYLAYTGYALYRQWGTEAATRLLLLLLIVLWVTTGRHVLKAVIKRLPACPLQQDKSMLLQKVAKWGLYVVALVGAVIYLALEVAPHEPRNLICLAGIAFLLLVGLLLSTAPERVNWHAVFWGIALQFYLAIFVLRTSVRRDMFEWVGDRIKEFISYTDAGTRFIFGDAYTLRLLSRTYNSQLEAMAKAVKEGVSIAVSVCANIIVFNALLAFLDQTVEWFGDQAGVDNLSFSEWSIVMSTYIMCGFANITAIGITVGLFTTLAPQRTKDIIKHVIRAAIAGNIACFLTGCVAGLLYK